MSGQLYTITFTAGLIEKLAGIKKPTQRHDSSSGFSSNALVHPEVLALKQQDARLARALTSSQRVGNLLLKQEQEEEAKIKQLTSDLLQHYSTPTRPVPCQAQRQACLECYTQNTQDPLRCATLVDAYTACADKSFDARMSRIAA